MAGCGKEITEWVARGFRYMEITMQCGDSCEHGGVYLCPKCDEADRFDELSDEPDPEGC